MYESEPYSKPAQSNPHTHTPFWDLVYYPFTDAKVFHVAFTL